MQYFQILQDSKCHLTHPTAQVQPSTQVPDITLTERQRLKDDNLSMTLRFCSLSLRTGPNDIGLAFLSGHPVAVTVALKVHVSNRHSIDIARLTPQRRPMVYMLRLKALDQRDKPWIIAAPQLLLTFADLKLMAWMLVMGVIECRNKVLCFVTYNPR